MSGNLFVISGPSGVGKDSLMALVLRSCLNLQKWVTCTTRHPRAGEVQGISYFFKTEEQFNQMIKNNELIEYNCFNDYYYGTPKFFAHDSLNKGKNIITAIDVNGAYKVKDFFEEAHLIFVEPPRIEELAKRLHKRGTDSEHNILKRLDIARAELLQKGNFDVTFINDDLKQCSREIINYINNICK